MPGHALIASAVRTPIGRRGGSLSGVHAGVLLGETIAEALRRSAVPPEAVDQVLAGCVTQVGDQAYNIGRIAWLTAGLPDSVPGTTLDAQCGSSHQAVSLGSALIESGGADVVVAAGVEVMSRHPLGSNVQAAVGNPLGAEYREHYEVINQGESAERIADKWGIDRAECDAIGLRSQTLARDAWAGGRFNAEVVAVDLPIDEDRGRATLARDEGLRDSTIEGLGRLKAVFRADGRHTAGNSSQISDAAALSAEAAERFEVQPLGAVTAQTVVGVDPVLKLTGPIPATARILQRSGLALNDFALFEVNEAFASVVGAWLRETGAPLEKVNVNGGAIALGHPVGATGVRLCATAVHELRRRGGGRALVTMCCGGGLGTATVIESHN
jgi:acetyl-CoA acetyltransferase family protein